MAVENYGGEFPPRERVLRSLPGVGVTCASLVLALVCEQEKLCVGSHVMRVTQRWGLVTATSATGVESQLGQIIPREKWRFVSEWFVAFGETRVHADQSSLRWLSAQRVLPAGRRRWGRGLSPHHRVQRAHRLDAVGGVDEQTQ